MNQAFPGHGNLKEAETRRVRRKKSKKSTRIGSVEPLGQRIMIRIIEGQYLDVHRIYRYRYEVMSTNSKYFRNIDFVTTNELLKESHVYSVRLNADKLNPKISKVFKEII